MTALGQLLRGTQHVALHAAKGEIFEYNKRKSHLQDCMRKYWHAIYIRHIFSAKLHAPSHCEGASPWQSSSAVGMDCFVISFLAMTNVMKKILLVKTSSMGDVIHNLPVVNDILQHIPDAQIDWVVEESFADIPKLHPAVHHVIPVAMRRWRKQLFSKATWQETRTVKETLSGTSYDAVIDTQGLLKSAWLAHYANGPRMGYDWQSIREPLASLFYGRCFAISYQQHAVTRNRTLAAMSLDYPIPTDAPDYGILKPDMSQNSTPESRMDIGLQSSDIGQEFIVGLHGTSRDSKLWPVAQWVALGQALNAQGLALVLPWASPAELERAVEISGQVERCTVLPKLSIEAIAGVIAGAAGAVGVDTGLSHLATALSIPTIAIYTDTNPALTGVMAGRFAPAINLGGIGQPPSADEVLQNLKKIIKSA
jgi:heptosyltransferase-1